MERRENVHISETRGGTGGIQGQRVEEKSHVKTQDQCGGKQEECFERKGVLGGGEKVEHHLREDAGDVGGSRKMDYQRKDDPSTGFHKEDYHATEGEKDEGILDKAGRKLGLKK